MQEMQRKEAEEEWKNQTDIVKESSVEIKPEEECRNPEECAICETRKDRILEEEHCTYESCWHNTLKGKELEEAKEAYERSEV